MIGRGRRCTYINHLAAKPSYLNFHPLKVVSRYLDPQLQVGENDSYVLNLGSQN